MEGVAWKQMWVGIDQIQSNLNSWYCSNTGKASTKAEHQTHMNGSPGIICNKSTIFLKKYIYSAFYHAYMHMVYFKYGMHN